MEKTLESADLARKVARLAFGRANDAVRLAFLDPDQAELIRGLDLSLVSEIRRSNNGTVEVRLLDRLALLRFAAELLEDKTGGAAGFFAALNNAARQEGAENP